MASRHRAVRADTWLRADAVPVLAALRQRGLRTGVISDCTHELPAFLPQLAVAPLLDVRVFSVQVGRCKPDPTLYLTACQRLGLAPGDCLYVGDGGSQELTGAERAGMTAVRLAAPDLATHMVFNADRDWRGPTLGTLAEVLALVDADAGGGGRRRSGGLMADRLISGGGPGAAGTACGWPGPPESAGAARPARRPAAPRRPAAYRPGRAGSPRTRRRPTGPPGRRSDRAR